MAKPPIINLDDLSFRAFEHGENFSAQLGAIGSVLGMNNVGMGMVVLEPGKRGWPFHEHYAQEEFFIVLSGEGSIRFADETHPIKTGDVIYTPPGKNTAHQIINTSNEQLRYLAFSTTESPEICYYPDSGKYGSYHYEKGKFPVRFMAHESSSVDYYDGE